MASIFRAVTLIEPDPQENKPTNWALGFLFQGEFSVPSNLDIYGTMNTADRSVEAWTRPFEEGSIRGDWAALGAFQDKVCEGINVGDLLRTINQRIEHLLDKDRALVIPTSTK